MMTFATCLRIDLLPAARITAEIRMSSDPDVDHSVGVWRGYRCALAREDLQLSDEPAEDVQHDADVATVRR
jgi:hypothetical protein